MKTKNLIKKLIKIWFILIICILTIHLSSNLIYAGEDDLQVDWFNIMPKLSENGVADANSAIEKVWVLWGHVREEYNTIADQIDTSKQIATWIMNWDTIMNYLVFIVQFLSQLGLLVWAGFIMYAWYKYMLSVFNGWKLPSETIKNAIIWIIIIIFSYAILKTLTSIIGIS